MIEVLVISIQLGCEQFKGMEGGAFSCKSMKCMYADYYILNLHSVAVTTSIYIILVARCRHVNIYIYT
jgi:hypothetical protein